MSEPHRFDGDEQTGLCRICGNTREKCQQMEQIWMIGGSSGENQTNSAISIFNQIPDRCTVMSVACTKFNSFLLSTAGTVYSWGETTHAIGRNLVRREDARIPMPVDQIRDVCIRQIAAGESHVMALDSNMLVWVWGFNKFGQLGLKDTRDRDKPHRIKKINDIHRIYAGGNCSFAVSMEGSVYAWGENKNCQLGIIKNNQPYKNSPVMLTDSGWDKTPDINVVAEKRGKQPNPGNMGGTSTSNAAIRQLQIENEDLMRRNDRLNERIGFLEEELYGSKVRTGGNVWDSDTLLLEITKNLNELTTSKEENQKSYNELDEEIDDVSQKIETYIMANKMHVQSEDERWTEIEELEQQIRGYTETQEKLSSQAQEQLKKLREKKEAAHGYVAKCQQMRTDEMTSLIDRETQLTNKRKQIEELKADMEKDDHKFIVYNQLQFIRKKDLSYKDFAKNQNSAEQDLLNIVSLNEALEHTSVEYLSKKMKGRNMRQLLRTSNRLIDKLVEESDRIKKPDEAAFQTLNKVWNILHDNCDLRLQLNNYTEGLNMQMSKRLEEYYHQRAVPVKEDVSSNRVTPAQVELEMMHIARRQPGQPNLDNLPEEWEEEEFQDHQKAAVAPPADKSWRSCI